MKAKGFAKGPGQQLTHDDLEPFFEEEEKKRSEDDEGHSLFSKLPFALKTGESLEKAPEEREEEGQFRFFAFDEEEAPEEEVKTARSNSLLQKGYGANDYYSAFMNAGSIFGRPRQERFEEEGYDALDELREHSPRERKRGMGGAGAKGALSESEEEEEEGGYI